MEKKARETGFESEELAGKYLESLDYEILGRNIRRPYGEIDILCRKNSVLVAVEVKTMPRSWTDDQIAYMVNERKLFKIRRVLASFVANNPGLFYYEVRFDVIVVLPSKTIKHYEGVQ